MKSLLTGLFLLASSLSVYGMGFGHGNHGMMGQDGCDQGPMKDVQMKIENEKDGVTIKMTSKDEKTINFLQRHAEFMKEHQDND